MTGRGAPTASLSARPVRGPALLCVVSVVAGVLACGCAAPPAPVAVPSFAVAQSTAPAAAPTGRSVGALPTDCGQVLSVEDLIALFGRPLGTVAVAGIRGVPEPSIGRIERLGCHYTDTGPGNELLLTLDIGRYRDPTAAARQWRLNSGAERTGSTGRDVTIGAAPAVLVTAADRSELIVSYRDYTLTVLVPGQPVIAGRATPEVLIDLARRALPQFALTPTTPTSQTLPATPIDRSAAGRLAAATPAAASGPVR